MHTENTCVHLQGIISTTSASASGPPGPEERPVSIGNLLNSGPTGQLFHYQTGPCVYIPQTPDKLGNNSSPFSPVCDYCWSNGSWRDAEKLPMLTYNDARRTKKKKRTKNKTMLSWMNRLISKKLFQILLLVLLIMLDIVWLSKVKSWHVTSPGQLSCCTGSGHWRGKWSVTWLTRNLPRWWLSRALSSWKSSYCSWKETKNSCSDRDASLCITASFKYINGSTKLYCMSAQVTGPISCEGHTGVMWFLSCWPNHEEHIVLSFVLTGSPVREDSRLHC